MKRNESELKFVNLHSHSVIGSPFDALGYPAEHFDFAYENGMDAMALTDHGNMNGYSYALLHTKEMNEKGKRFKYIPGMEAYYIDDVVEWRKEYEKARQDKERKKEIKEEEGFVFEEANRELQGSVRGNSHFLLLAKNQVGLNNLFSLVSATNDLEQDYFFRKPRIDYNLLKKHSEGIIATTTCISGIYAKLVWANPESTQEELIGLMRPYIEKFIDIFGKENYFVELQWNAIKEQHILNQCKIALAKEYGLKLISTVDSHYARPELWKQREMYKRLGYINRPKMPEWMPREMPETIEEVGYELYPKNGDQMFADYKKYSQRMGFEYDDDVIKESIENTYYIAHELVEDYEPDCSIQLPDFILDERGDANLQLKELCLKRLKEKNLDDNEEYKKRLNHELSVIESRDFAKYFLATKFITDEGHERMFVGPGRGSGTGSLVTYLLDITQIDPLKWGTQFSRFLRTDDTGYPDIDIDFSKNDEMREYLTEMLGMDTCVFISNWNTLQLRSLIKDISKYYEIPFDEVNNVTKVMVHEATGPAKEKHGITAGVYNPTWEEVLEYSHTLQAFLEKYPYISEHVRKLVGEVRSGSVHAGGLVLGKNLKSRLPLIRSKGKIKSPFSEGQNVRHLEPLGHIKFDILGLESLHIMEKAIEFVLKKERDDVQYKDVKKFYDRYLHPDVINPNDEHVMKNVYHDGRFPGIFQFSKAGAQQYVQRAKPNGVLDITTLTSLYRPGPMSLETHEAFIHNKKRPSTIDYICKEYKEVTESTYGILTFQEQISELSAKIGFPYISEEDGQKIRKLLTKKEKGGVKENIEDIEDEFVRKMVYRDFSIKNATKLKQYYDKFMLGGKEKNIKEENLEKMWNTMEEFAGYGFSRNHALAYAFVSYQCAWLFTYYPTEWLCAYLNVVKESDKEEALGTVKSLGFNIAPVSLNSSQQDWTVADDKLLPPLISVKGLGEKAVGELLKYRPFNSIEDLIYNDDIDYRRVNKKVLNVLVRSCALDELIEKDDRFLNQKHLWNCIVENKDRTKNREEFEELIEETVCDEFSLEEKIDNILSLTGLYPFDLVVSKRVQNVIKGMDLKPISKLEETDVCWFIVQQKIQKKTKNKKNYWILKAIDITGMQTEVKVWGVQKNDRIRLNEPIMGAVDYSPQWGFSMRHLASSIQYLT